MNQLNTRRGFTLMELLIVVLIIGILSAVALPQYQRAVLKSRFAALKPTADAIKTAQEAYYMEHGEYADNMQDLTVKSTPTGEHDTVITFSETDGYDYVRASTDLSHNRYTLYLDHSKQFPGNVYCEALATDENAKGLCIAEGGTHVDTDNGYMVYYLSGNGTGAFSPIASSTSCGGGCIRYSFKEGVPAQMADVYSDRISIRNSDFVYDYDSEGEVTQIRNLSNGIPCYLAHQGYINCGNSNYSKGNFCDTFSMLCNDGESIL